MFNWFLGAFLSIGLVATFSDWANAWVYLRLPTQIFGFGFLFILLFSWFAIKASGVWAKGQGIFDDWDGLLDKVNEIYDKVIGEEEEALAASSSPVSLTARGQEVADQINAKALVEKYIEQIDFSEVENAYDIQHKARNWAGEELPKIMDAEDLTRLKNVAFETGLSISLIARTVIGLMIRDAVLKEKGIPFSRLDSDERAKKGGQ